MSVAQSFHQALIPHRARLTEASTVLVAFSGGADSSCLLRLMHDWGRDNGIAVAAAHLHHGIRGAEADEDAAFCRSVCAVHGIVYHERRVDVPALAEAEKISLEWCARRERYAFFEEVALSYPTRPLLVTAHNADDNLETVLMNLLRGSGLHGMAGMPPLRDGWILRPLLTVSAADIRAWCRDNDVPYRTDSTNTDTDYTRNAIRHTVTPALRALGAEPTAAVTRMTTLLRRDDDYLEHEARRIAGDATALSVTTLDALHPAIASRVLRILYNNAKDTDATIESAQIDTILAWPSNARQSVSLPGKMRCTRAGGVLTMEADSGRRETVSNATIPAPFFYPTDGDVYENAAYRVTFSQNNHILHEANAKIYENIYKLSILTTLRFDKIKGVLRIRTRLPGDTLTYGGIRHKVRRLFIDGKVSAALRKSIPILCDDNGIVWIPGYPPRDGLVYEGEGVPLCLHCQTR